MVRVHYLNSGILQVGDGAKLRSYFALAGGEEDVPDEIAAQLVFVGLAILVPSPPPKKRRKSA